MSESKIAWILANRDSPVYYRRQQCVVPNVSWGWDLSYEADLIAVSKSKYVTEVEIKTTISDWKNDFKKKKHVFLPSSKIIKRFYYCAWKPLAERYAELEIPSENYGVIAVDGETERCTVLKFPKDNRNAKPVSDEKLMRLMRLGCMRIWN